MAKRRKASHQKRGRRFDYDHEIDNIAKYCQQRRSPRCSKRRTDFSFFICSSSILPGSPLSQDLLLESPSSKEILSTVTLVSSDEINDTRRNICDLSLHRYSEFEEKGEGLFTNCIEVPVVKVQSVGQNAPLKPCGNRSDDERSDSARTMEFTPDKSQIVEKNDVCITPGSVVWAKTAEQWWWPAEVLEEKSALVGSSTQCIDGQVLVQYYGKHESAWVQPARDLSLFDECFEERSCNPAKEFQNALKQALYCKEHMRSSKELFTSPDRPDCSNHLDQSPDKGNSSSSSRAGSGYIGRGRSKRERKPIARFDEVTYPLKSSKKLRRFRIMRSLGLAAPVGSPFLTPANTRSIHDADSILHTAFALHLLSQPAGLEEMSCLFLQYMQGP